MSKWRLYSSHWIVIFDSKKKSNKKELKKFFLGRWKKYDAGIDLAVIQYDGHEVQVDTAQIDRISPIEGDIVQCIGEVTEEVRTK